MKKYEVFVKTVGFEAAAPARSAILRNNRRGNVVGKSTGDSCRARFFPQFHTSGRVPGVRCYNLKLHFGYMDS